MFIIFGLDDRKPDVVITENQEYCNHCHNTTYWHLAKHQTNFSLFFLPVFPVKTRYYYLCPICNHGDEISSERYHELLHQIPR